MSDFDNEIQEMASEMTAPGGLETAPEAEAEESTEEVESIKEDSPSPNDVEDAPEADAVPEAVASAPSTSEKFAARVRYERKQRELEAKLKEKDTVLSQLQQKIEESARFDITAFNNDPIAYLEQVGIDPNMLIDRIANDQPSQGIKNWDIEKKLEAEKQAREQWQQEQMMEKQRQSGLQFIKKFENIVTKEDFPSVRAAFSIFGDGAVHNRMAITYQDHIDNGLGHLTEQELAVKLEEELSVELNDLSSRPELKKFFGQTAQSSETAPTQEPIGKSNQENINSVGRGATPLANDADKGYDDLLQEMIDNYQ